MLTTQSENYLDSVSTSGRRFKLSLAIIALTHLIIGTFWTVLFFTAIDGVGVLDWISQSAIVNQIIFGGIWGLWWFPSCLVLFWLLEPGILFSPIFFPLCIVHSLFVGYLLVGRRSKQKASTG